MALTVRHVLAHEADRLREIRLRSLASDPDAFGSTYERDAARPAEWWERSAANPEQRTFVAVRGADEWVGMALVRPGEGAAAVINAMWVAPEARGRGAGRALVDACCAWAHERGFEAVMLSVRSANAPARAAYAAAGFECLRAEGDELVLKRALV
ncbi:GNAT family N-acetyltransferase [Solirubrobacter sp. CPCC 204708]|uniref:GNAT family N-acetyltransferase n=1 Tax=Solirubrobacter deserti TaxID=2282478 RepID=A0ABT4RPL0_9ACTN|nr:GNAT family N-acetyltransferase [Solirubrobacter deserti]MBE2319912.1 GNAT family N-acetyltransferase [Solirubrobacter deserti]MDA0140494.1 GNAT family N-acetyltransferase [Solirubrobacter deserti]